MAEKSNPSSDPGATTSSSRRQRRPRTSVVPADPRVPASSRKVVLAKGTDPFLGRVPEGMEPHIRRIIESRTPEQTEETAQEITESVAPLQAEGSAQPARAYKMSAKQKAAAAAAAERKAAKQAAQVEAARAGAPTRGKASQAEAGRLAAEAEASRPVTRRELRTTVSKPTPESPITEMDIDLMRMGINPDTPPSEMRPKKAMFGRMLYTKAPDSVVADLEGKIKKAGKTTVKRKLLEERLDRVYARAADNRIRIVEEGYLTDPKMSEEGAAEEAALTRRGLVAPPVIDPRRRRRVSIPRSSPTAVFSVDPGMAGLTADQLQEVQKGMAYESALSSSMGMDYSTGQAEALLDPEPSSYVRNASDIPRVKPNPLLEEYEVRRVSPSGEVLPGAQDLYNVQQASRARRRAVIAQNREADEYNAAIAGQNRQNAATAALAEQRGVQPPPMIPRMPTRTVPGSVSGRTMGVPVVEDLEYSSTQARLAAIAAAKRPKDVDVDAPTSFIKTPATALRQNLYPRSTEMLAVPQKPKKTISGDVRRSVSFVPTTSGSDVVHYRIPGGVDQLAQDLQRMGAQMGMNPSPEQLNNLQRVGDTVSLLRGTRPSVISPFRQRRVAGGYSEAAHAEATSALDDLTNQISEHKIMMTATRSGVPTAAGRARLSELETLHAQAKARVSGMDVLRTQDAQDRARAAAAVPAGTKGFYQRQGGMGQYGRVKTVPMKVADEEAAVQADAARREEALNAAFPPHTIRGKQMPTIFSASDIRYNISKGRNVFSQGWMGQEGKQDLARHLAVDPSLDTSMRDAASRAHVRSLSYAIGQAMRNPLDTSVLEDIAKGPETTARNMRRVEGAITRGQQFNESLNSGRS